MKIPKFRALVDQVEPAQETKNGRLFRKLVLRVPAYINEFGEKKGEDQYYEAFIFGEYVESLPKVFRADKVEVAGYLNGRQWLTTDSKLAYSTTFSVTELSRLS